MQVLSVIHGDEARTELFAPVVEEAGHRLDEWSFAWGTPPPRPLETYDAVLVFGGAMHADHDEHHPWLGKETHWLKGLLAHGKPLMGLQATVEASTTELLEQFAICSFQFSIFNLGPLTRASSSGNGSHPRYGTGSGSDRIQKAA